MNITEKELPTVFKLYPTQKAPIGLLSIPHSGEVIPEEFRQYFHNDAKAINEDVDYKVHELVNIKELNDSGVIVLVAHIHRTCVDLNRKREICVTNWKKNSQGIEIIKKNPSSEEQERLTQKYYDPYYEILKTTLKKIEKVTKSTVSFVDLHSMPSKPTAYHLAITPNQPKARPGFCVSDIEGISCKPQFINHFCEQLKSVNEDVLQNIPYFGGNITRHTHATVENVENIQIEINRSLYMNEKEKTLLATSTTEFREKLTNALIKGFELNQ